MTVDSHQKAHPYDGPQVSELGSETQSATPEYKRHAVYSRSEWLLESISSILALGLLIAIAVIFWYMDKKPLSAWRAGVSLNASVSILTTACTTALMHGVSTFIGQSKWLHFKNGPRKLEDLETFDGASRGVWGSILLLTAVKWNLATIGAFITILRLAFSPFAQQVVLIEQRDIITPSNTASFGYAHSYIDTTLTRDLGNAYIENVQQDPGMQSAIIQGLYGLNTTESFKCPGLCDWPSSYISLGYKTECRNVTQETLQTATCGKISVQNICNMTTPGGVNLTTRHVFTDSGTTYNMNTSSVLDKLAYGMGPSFPEIIRFGIYRSTMGGSFQLTNPNITECSLSLTAHEYTGARANGSDFSVVKREVDFGVKNPWALKGNSTDLNFNYIYTNETTNGDLHIPALEMTYGTITSLAAFFQSTTVVSDWITGNVRGQNLGFATALSGDVDLGDRFDKMANGMSMYMRYGPNTLAAHGEIRQSEPHVFIRWRYFIVPILIEAFAILFAILSIFSNRPSRRVPLWKSSTLAVLACQHEERLGLLQTTGKDLEDLEIEAKKAEVQLR
ncbi:uncharacterized protein PGRI_087630 [Penicillium griseofulvum]|uniref:Uncharacterized protein n=1 Tax=Penicillium patulum TaxID=5078 RepID=A0A135LU84_PENPA|nr:uncharacterized protein PGRI_087630 [Penicillium griseofulvum]KXG52479.1 hypothetical protein PGRI_087630 [Penicillium griseofulvum]